jgi:hypothetical protein
MILYVRLGDAGTCPVLGRESGVIARSCWSRSRLACPRVVGSVRVPKCRDVAGHSARGAQPIVAEQGLGRGAAVASRITANSGRVLMVEADQQHFSIPVVDPNPDRDVLGMPTGIYIVGSLVIPLSPQDGGIDLITIRTDQVYRSVDHHSGV